MPDASSPDAPNTSDSDVTAAEEGAPDMIGAPREDIANLVDDLEEKVLSEAGNPQQKITDDAHASGTDHVDGDAEPPI